MLDIVAIIDCYREGREYTEKTASAQASEIYPSAPAYRPTLEDVIRLINNRLVTDMGFPFEHPHVNENGETIDFKLDMPEADDSTFYRNKILTNANRHFILEMQRLNSLCGQLKQLRQQASEELQRQREAEVAQAQVQVLAIVEPSAPPLLDDYFPLPSAPMLSVELDADLRTTIIGFLKKDKHNLKEHVESLIKRINQIKTEEEWKAFAMSSVMPNALHLLIGLYKSWNDAAGEAGTEKELGKLIERLPQKIPANIWQLLLQGMANGKTTVTQRVEIMEEKEFKIFGPWMPAKVRLRWILAHQVSKGEKRDRFLQLFDTEETLKYTHWNEVRDDSDRNIAAIILEIMTQPTAYDVTGDCYSAMLAFAEQLPHRMPVDTWKELCQAKNFAVEKRIEKAIRNCHPLFYSWLAYKQTTLAEAVYRNILYIKDEIGTVEGQIATLQKVYKCFSQLNTDGDEKSVYEAVNKSGRKLNVKEILIALGNNEVLFDIYLDFKSDSPTTVAANPKECYKAFLAYLDHKNIKFSRAQLETQFDKLHRMYQCYNDVLGSYDIYIFIYNYLQNCKTEKTQPNILSILKMYAFNSPLVLDAYWSHQRDKNIYLTESDAYQFKGKVFATYVLKKLKTKFSDQDLADAFADTSIYPHGLAPYLLQDTNGINPALMITTKEDGTKRVIGTTAALIWQTYFFSILPGNIVVNDLMLDTMLSIAEEGTDVSVLRAAKKGNASDLLYQSLTTSEGSMETFIGALYTRYGQNELAAAMVNLNSASSAQDRLHAVLYCMGAMSKAIDDINDAVAILDELVTKPVATSITTFSSVLSATPRTKINLNLNLINRILELALKNNLCLSSEKGQAEQLREVLDKAEQSLQSASGYITKEKSAMQVGVGEKAQANFDSMTQLIGKLELKEKQTKAQQTNALRNTLDEYKRFQKSLTLPLQQVKDGKSVSDLLKAFKLISWTLINKFSAKDVKNLTSIIAAICEGEGTLAPKDKKLLEQSSKQLQKRTIDIIWTTAQEKIDVLLTKKEPLTTFDFSVIAEQLNKMTETLPEPDNWAELIEWQLEWVDTIYLRFYDNKKFVIAEKYQGNNDLVQALRALQSKKHAICNKRDEEAEKQKAAQPSTSNPAQSPVVQLPIVTSPRQQPQLQVKKQDEWPDLRKFFVQSKRYLATQKVPGLTDADVFKDRPARFMNIVLHRLLHHYHKTALDVNSVELLWKNCARTEMYENGLYFEFNKEPYSQAHCKIAQRILAHLTGAPIYLFKRTDNNQPTLFIHKNYLFMVLKVFYTGVASSIKLETECDVLLNALLDTTKPSDSNPNPARTAQDGNKKYGVATEQDALTMVDSAKEIFLPQSVVSAAPKILAAESRPLSAKQTTMVQRADGEQTEIYFTSEAHPVAHEENTFALRALATTSALMFGSKAKTPLIFVADLSGSMNTDMEVTLQAQVLSRDAPVSRRGMPSSVAASPAQRLPSRSLFSRNQRSAAPDSGDEAENSDDGSVVAAPVPTEPRISRRNLVLKAIEELINSLPEDTPYVVIGYHSQAAILGSSENAQTFSAAAVDESFSGGTQLKSIVDLLKTDNIPTSNEPYTMVVLTDGGDGSGQDGAPIKKCIYDQFEKMKLVKPKIYGLLIADAETAFMGSLTDQYFFIQLAGQVSNQIRNMKDLLGTGCPFEMEIKVEQAGKTLMMDYKNTSIIPGNEEDALVKFTLGNMTDPVVITYRMACDGGEVFTEQVSYPVNMLQGSQGYEALVDIGLRERMQIYASKEPNETKIAKLSKWKGTLENLTAAKTTYVAEAITKFEQTIFAIQNDAQARNALEAEKTREEQGHTGRAARRGEFTGRRRSPSPPSKKN